MKIVCTRETETLKESVWIINNKPDKKTSRKWLGTRIVQNMQCLSSILTSVSIQYTALKSLQDRFQLKRYAAILWTEVRARAFTFWLDPDRLVGKAKIVLWQCSSEQWNIQNRQRDTHLRMLYTVRGVKESVCVRVSVCVKACVMDLSLRAALPALWVSFISDPLHHPGWSFWCAAGGLCATGPGVRSSRTLLPAGRQRRQGDMLFFNPPNYILKVMLTCLNLLHITGYFQRTLHNIQFSFYHQHQLILWCVSLEEGNALIADLARPAVITTLPSLNTTTDKREEMRRLTDECFNQSIYNEQKSKKRIKNKLYSFCLMPFVHLIHGQAHLPR